MTKDSLEDQLERAHLVHKGRQDSSYVHSDIQDGQLGPEHYSMYTRANNCVHMYRLNEGSMILLLG